MYRRRDFSWLERSCIAFAFIAGGLASYSAFRLLGRLPRHWWGDLPELAAATLFIAVTGLILKGVDVMRNERIHRLIKEAEERLGRRENSN